MKESVKQFVQQTFDIREGELERTVLMQLFIFLIISTLLIIKPTINSLFLSEVGIQNLPLAFILVAIGAGIITTFYSRLLNKMPLNKIINYTLIVSVISIAVFSILLRLNFIEKWVLYVFYVWVAIFGVLATSQFWILANIVFNAREAKRLFSVIGGGAIAGGIFGGYLTSLLAPIFGSENLLFVGVLFLIICIPLNKRIWNANKSTAQSVFKRKQRAGKVSEHPIRLIINSKHLTYLALITAISVLVAKLVDYQFSAISASKIKDPDELTSFFGFWFSNFNIISLAIQLFVTRRVVGVYGVGVSLFFLPAGLFIGALSVLLTPGLASAVFIKSADGSLKQSLNKSALELLALPIPAEIKNQAKTFIDVFVDSFATGFSGIILIMVVNGFHLSVQFVSFIILILILCWFYFARKVRLEYLKLFMFKLNVKNDSLKNVKPTLDINNESVYGGLTKVLENGTESQILFVLSHVEDSKHEKLFTSITNLLHHPSNLVVKEALQKLCFYRKENVSSNVIPLLNHTDSGVRVAAVQYLIEHADENRLETINTYLKHPDYKVRGATLLAITDVTKDNSKLRSRLNLAGLIQNRLDELPKITNDAILQFKKMNLLKVIGNANLPQFYPFIHHYLKNEETELQQIAIQSAGNTLDSAFIPVLLTLLPNKETKTAAVNALAMYGFKLIPTLIAELEKGSKNIEIIREFSHVAEKIATQESVHLLFKLSEFEDISVRNEAVQSLSALKVQKPHLIFNNKQIVHHILDEAKLFSSTLSALYIQQESIKTPEIIEHQPAEIVDGRKSLIKLLEKRLDDNLDRIFKILGLKYPPEEINMVYKGIRSDKADIRINSIEFLDNLLDSELKRVLIPLIETSLADTITKESLKELRVKVITQYECFSMLLEGKDLRIKLAVLYLITVLADAQYARLVESYRKHPDLKISSFAQKAWEACNK